MQEIYSALLLHSAGQKITEENIKKVLQSIEASVDEGKIRALVSSLEGVNIEEAVKQAAVPVAAPAEEKKEKKVEKGEEKKAEETASAGLSALFG